MRWGNRLASAVRALLDQVPIVKPVLPDPGVPFSSRTTTTWRPLCVRGVLGRGRPGAYNLAGPGEITMSNLAEALGYRAVPVPDLAVDATAEVIARLPFLPDEVTWIEAVGHPTLMDTTKARRDLAWRPRHDACETLRATVAAARPDLATGATE